jgi:hypothetical protein
MKLRIKIVALLLTIVVFVQFSAFYFAQIKASEEQSDIDRIINNIDNFTTQTNKFSEIVLEQLKGHEDKFGAHDNLFSEINKSMLEIGNMIADIDKDVDGLIEGYGRLDYLYNQINIQTKTDNIENNEDMRDLYYGRLHIPSADINVALYYGWQQYITDRADSANIFSWKDFDSCTIADHNNQEFSKLFDVQIGALGYIELKNGETIKIECVDVFNGHNTGQYIINEYGVNTVNKGDYIMYTCVDHWTNVRICIWNIV